MKKFTNVKSVSAVILCFILAFALCACQNAEPSSSSDDATSAISSPSVSINDEIDTDTTVNNSSDEKTSSETTNDTPSKDNQPPATSSGTNTESSNTQSVTTDKTSTPSQPNTESTPITNLEIKLASELIVGKWHGSVDMAPMFAKEGYAVDGEMMVSCDIEFTKDGVIYETVDRASLKTAFTALLDKALKDEMTKNGITLEQFEASVGKSYDQYLSEYVQVAMDLFPQTITSEYRFVWDDLYVRGQDDADFVKKEYDFNGENELTLLEDGVAITYTRIG